MQKKKIFILIGILWLVIIIGFVVVKEFTLRTGTEVLLKTVPIDPRDLFRGDYVILRYKISTLDLNNIPADYTDISIGDKIYVSLDKENGYGVPRKIYRDIPKGKMLVMGGVVQNISGTKITVDYGIESYFVPEGKGKEIERMRGKNLDTKISIDRFGNTAIKSLLINGKELNFK